MDERLVAGGDRLVRPGRLRRQRWLRPVACWLHNRWAWREKRRVRADIAGWKRLAVPLDQLDVDVLDPHVSRMARVAEGLGYSAVLHLGYGMSEAIVAGTTQEPDRMRPLVELASRYSDDQLRGADQSPDGTAAVAARNALLLEARKVVADHPKCPPAGRAPR